jgi:hypothetical protein
MKQHNHHPILLAAFAILATGLLTSAAQAQTLRLRQAGTNSIRVGVQVGQVINIEVVANLQGVASAGIQFFVSLPSNVFLVTDQSAQSIGIQPFSVPTNSLFANGVTASNFVLPESDPLAASLEGQQLDFSAVIGLGSNREQVGSGVVATFQLIALQPVENGQIKIDDNPIRETKLVLTDGLSERRFVTTQGMEINVSGLELLDIPDVILQPGASDSIQIGSLDRYLVNTLSIADSIRWTFETADPADLENVTVTVDPETRVVKIVPLPDWRGSVRLVWTATDPQRASPGQPFLTAVNASTIVVNNRPSFDIMPDSNGVKRDTVRLVEDRNPFVPGINTQDERRAFRAYDLDDIVFDPDVTGDAADVEFNYAFSPLPLGTQVRDANVLGGDSATHDLLIWTRPDFGGSDTLEVLLDGVDTVGVVIGGRDSMRVLVRDRFGGLDTLQILVEVVEIADPPRIIEEDTNTKLARGGTKTYVLTSFVEDPDTPLEDLIFSWVDDPDGRFRVDTLRTNTGDQNFVLTVTGDPAFIGTGRVVIKVADPLDPLLFAEETFFFTAAEALPPSVFPNNTKVPNEPGGIWTSLLDDFVSDPDNVDDELRWSIPVGSKSTISIDAGRNLSVESPNNFHGFEQVILTVADPAGQSDMLTLRIYSSDGRPMTGGIPDLVLDRGEQHREFDLDEYYHDSNNSDEEMTWRAQPTFEENNISVSVDPLTHIVTYAVAPNSSFGTETVVFRVTDTDGASAQDTMLVTIQSGGQGSDGAFQIIPDLPLLQAPVGQAIQVLNNLMDFVVTTPDLPRSTITWELVEQGTNGIANPSRRIDPTVPDGVRWVLTVFGETSGVDTLHFVVTDSLGRSESATTTIKYFGESELLELRAIPDIVFIAGEAFDGLTLNDFILDRETHTDSLVSWSLQDIGTTDLSIIPRIFEDSSVRVLGFDIGETEVIFIARNDSLGVTGRDTVRIIAQDPSLAELDLQPFPPFVLQAGATDSSLVLNDFLPLDLLNAAQANWSVSGATITIPNIDPVAPHLLRINSVGTTVGMDTLDFRVTLGGGFTATGQMVVTVIEPIDESTLSLRVVPNPLSANYLDFFVIARTELTSSPTVVVTFESDTTVAVRQIEDQLTARGVLIWAGSFRVRIGGTGTLLFRAQAITALGTSLSAQSSIALATASAGKPLALHHDGIEVLIPANALPPGQLVYLQSGAPGPESGAGAPKRAAMEELALRRELQLSPAGLHLQRPARIAVAGMAAQGAGLYRSAGDGWQWVDGQSDGAAEVHRLGSYAVLTDTVAPRIEVEDGQVSGQLRVLAFDGGSGVDADHIYALAGGERFDVSSDGEGWVTNIHVADPKQAGLQEVVLVAHDRAGNVTRYTTVLKVVALPRQMALGANYPNPFNPETTIPVQLSAVGAQSVRLRIYNAAGQVVRELLDETQNPGWHEVHWDGRDQAGRHVSSGVYFYRLEGTGPLLIRSMTLLK